jgi:hypothetical protein
MGPFILAPVLAGIGALFLTGITGCAGQKPSNRGARHPNSNETDSESATVNIQPPPPKKSHPSEIPPPAKKTPILPLHWRILGLEQKLLAYRCRDGNPSVSLRDLRAFQSSKDFRTLADLYDQSISKHPEHLLPFRGQGFLPAYLYVGAYNLHLGLQEALATAPLSPNVPFLPAAIQVRTNLNWGSYIYFADTELTNDEIELLKTHVKKEFAKQGIHWNGELQIEVKRVPTAIPLYGYGFHFDLNPDCPRIQKI